MRDDQELKNEVAATTAIQQHAKDEGTLLPSILYMYLYGFMMPF